MESVRRSSGTSTLPPLVQRSRNRTAASLIAGQFCSQAITMERRLDQLEGNNGQMSRLRAQGIAPARQCLIAYVLRRTTAPSARPMASSPKVAGSGTVELGTIVTAKPVEGPGTIGFPWESSAKTFARLKLRMPEVSDEYKMCAITPAPLDPGTIPLRVSAINVIMPLTLSMLPGRKVVPAPRNGPSVTFDALARSAGSHCTSNCQSYKSTAPVTVTSTVKLFPRVTIGVEVAKPKMGAAAHVVPIATASAVMRSSCLSI